MYDFDGIILGAGHNGLILQSYLGRAGLKTACVDRAAESGGGLTTISFPPGSEYRHNIHSFFHRGVESLPWYEELQLEQRGARYQTPPLNVALICKDGRSLQWWTDFESTAASVADFSRRDADRLRQWRRRFQPIVNKILLPEAARPPLPPQQREASLRQSAEGRLLLEVSRLSPLEFVQQEFEHPIVRAGLLFFNGLREVDLRCPGFGYHIPALIAADRFAQMCLGGSRQLASALERAVTETGGSLILGQALRRIRVEQQRVVGVQLADGTELTARYFVASSLNPQQTFLELLEPEAVPKPWRQKAAAYQYNQLAPLFSLNLNLHEPPEYTACHQDPRLQEAFMVILGLDHDRQFREIVRHHERGTFPSPVMWGACPTQFDPTQAPPGKHVAFMWEKLPYRVQGTRGARTAENWDEIAEDHGKQLLRTWQKYAPNLRDAVQDSFVRTPLDTERRLPNMRHGDLLVGAFTQGQVGYHRPFPGAGHYRTHLPNLYLCGSCCHPGGNVTGLPGYNAAKIIRADLKL